MTLRQSQGVVVSLIFGKHWFAACFILRNRSVQDNRGHIVANHLNSDWATWSFVFDDFVLIWFFPVQSTPCKNGQIGRRICTSNSVCDAVTFLGFSDGAMWRLLLCQLNRVAGSMSVAQHGGFHTNAVCFSPCYLLSSSFINPPFSWLLRSANSEFWIWQFRDIEFSLLCVPSSSRPAVLSVTNVLSLVCLYHFVVR